MKWNLQKIISSVFRKSAILLVLFLSFNVLVSESQAFPSFITVKWDSPPDGCPTPDPSDTFEFDDYPCLAGLVTDQDNDGEVDPGDTIRYVVGISNHGTTNAENVLFQDTIDANTTLGAGSLRTTPIARNDQYSSLGNVGITVPAVSGVLLNDNDPDGGSVSVIAAAGGTANGGAFSIGSDGAFSYLPPTGFEGVDQFNYLIQDSDGNQDPATVFVVITEMIWFINNSAPAPGGGGITTPFNSINAFNAIQTGSAPGAKDGDIIFIYSGSGAYTSGITLLNNQYLIGQGATASIASITGITLPPFSNTLPATGGSNPTIGNPAGDGITVASNNLVRGLTVNNTSGKGLTGSSVNTLTVREVTISNANSNGIQLTSLSGTATFDNLSVIGSSLRNILIENNTGTATIGVTNSTVNTAGSDGFSVIGTGTANITFNVSNSTFTHNSAVQLKAHAEDSSMLNVNFTNNSFDGEPALVGNVGVDVAVRDSATLSFNINNNNFQPFRSQVANVFASGGGIASGSVNGNTILGSAYGAGIRAVAEVTDVGGTNPSITIEIDGNTISDIQGSGLAGIHIVSRDGNNSVTGTANVQASINNNDVTINGADSVIQALLNGGNTLCLDITNNLAAGSATSPFSPLGSTLYLGNPVIGDSLGSGNMTFDGYIANDLGTTWNNNGNSPVLAPGNAGEAFVDGTQPTNGTCATVASAQSESNTPRLAWFEKDDSTQKLALVRAVQSNLGAALETAFANYESQVGFIANRLTDAFSLRTAYASGETVSVSLGTLNFGQVVIITFDVTVDSTIPSSVSMICNQGLFTGNNFTDVLTDDWDLGGSADPTCTPIDNQKGTLTVVKLTEGGDGTFSFESDTLPYSSFNITTSSGTGSSLITNLFAGTYDITENVPSGWDLITSYCDNGDDPSSVTLGQGEDVTCTFENRKRGSLTVVKQTEGGDDTFNFESEALAFLPINITTNNGTGSFPITNLFTGTYDIAENVPSGWDLITSYCDNGDNPGAVYIAPGEDVTCTFENRKRGSLTVVKQTEGGDGTFNFESEALAFLSISITTNNGTGSFPITNLFTGTYDIAEIVPSGWDLITSSCSNGDDPGAVYIAPGEDVICTFENLFNQAPVANDDSYLATEDTTLNVGVGGGVLANDTDAEGDPLTAVLDTTTSHGSLTLNDDGSFSYEPDANYCDDSTPDSFTYHANDGLADSNVATVIIDVSCVDDPPIVTVDTVSQTVQYSDYIADVVVTATDVDSHPLGISDDAPSNLSTGGSCTAVDDGTSCSWTLSGQVLVAASTNTVTFTVSDETSDITAETKIVVQAEDAKVTFDSGNPVAVPVSSPGGDSEMFTLKVYVQEAFESGSDTGPGDINLAQVSLTLEPIGPGSSMTVACATTGAVAQFDYSAALEVECDFSGVPVNAYVATVSVGGGFYTGTGEDSLVVYDPSLGFTTGGGWFYWPGTDDRTTFGYNMKYNKKATKVQGNLILIRHLDDGTIFRLKSNAIDGLALGEETDFGWAVFSGKATYKDASWTDPEGNYTFTVYVEDHGEPGDLDRVWIEVRDKDGNVVDALSITPDGQTNAETLGGGNIVVPHSNSGGGNGKNNN